MKFGGQALNSAFSNIDSDFIKLTNASADSFLKVEFTVKHDINDIGGAFIKLGEGFGDLSEAGHKIDTAFLKLAIGSSTSGGGAGKVAQADFLALDTTLKTSSADLKILGSDFVKLDTAPDLLTIKLTDAVVSGDFLKVGTDMSDVSGAFIKLGTDLVALGSGENGNSPQLNEALKILGGDFEQKISPAFDALALDWHKLSRDFANLAGGGGDTTTTLSSAGASDSTPGVLGTDFLQLEHDFLLLNQALGATAPDIAAAFEALAQQTGKHPGDEGHEGNIFGPQGGKH
jgi:hypothetical protein